MKLKTITAALVAATALAAPAAANASTDRYCGSASNGLGVIANKRTSCSFAKAVANTFLAQQVRHIRVYSRATHRTYSMTCRTAHWPGPDANPYIRCVGGNGAVVKVVS